MHNLTEKQRALIEYIQSQHERGHYPSLEEMATEQSVTTQMVHRRLMALERKGYIERSGPSVKTIKMGWRRLTDENG